MKDVAKTAPLQVLITTDYVITQNPKQGRTFFWNRLPGAEKSSKFSSTNHNTVVIHEHH